MPGSRRAGSPFAGPGMCRKRVGRDGRRDLFYDTGRRAGRQGDAAGHDGGFASGFRLQHDPAGSTEGHQKDQAALSGLRGRGLGGLFCEWCGCSGKLKAARKKPDLSGVMQVREVQT